MNHPIVRYRHLRLHNLNTPEFSHLKLLLGWGVFFVLYALTENLIPPESCHVIHTPLDDRIPFCEFFVLFYVGWYGLIVASLLYFLRYSVESFRNLQTYINITMSIAMVIYLLYPNRQDLRPQVFPRENVLTAIVGALYAIDTNTCVMPSLHVAYSFGIASTWLREKSAKLWLKAAIAAFCFCVCLSVSFIKQHSVLDALAALPLCMLAEWFVFWRRKKPIENKKKSC